MATSFPLSAWRFNPRPVMPPFGKANPAATSRSKAAFGFIVSSSDSMSFPINKIPMDSKRVHCLLQRISAIFPK